MIPFERLNLDQKDAYEQILMQCPERGCEYSFANKFLWGRQKAAHLEGYWLFFSQFDRRSVYPFPIGSGDLKPAIDALIQDARERGIPCYLTSLTKDDCDTLEALYPGRFQFHSDRDSFDYIYSIEDLAQLKGRKFQKKRNHLNRFLEEHTDWQVLPLDEATQAKAYCMLQQWYAHRAELDPTMDFHLEKLALDRAFAFRTQLDMEGIVVMEKGEILAFTMGSRLGPDTFDIHFEKAREDIQGSYNIINREFARYLQAKYPEVKWLNREDDVGLEGLRSAKLSYNPDRLLEKYWARLWEDEDEI